MQGQAFRNYKDEESWRYEIWFEGRVDEERRPWTVCFAFPKEFWTEPPWKDGATLRIEEAEEGT
jgi:hypothetical protein